MITVDRLLDGGPVEVCDGTWRAALAPGFDISALPKDVQDAIAKHWNEDVGGQTRAQRYAASQAPDESTPRRIVEGVAFLSRVSDTEMMAILAAADKSAQIRRWIEQLRMLGEIDLDGATAQAAKAGLVAAGLLTQERAEIIFS